MSDDGQTVPLSIREFHSLKSSASPVKLRLRVGPHALSGKKKRIREQGVNKKFLGLSVRNAPKQNKLGVISKE
jgi:hypothetical protein